MFTVWNTKNLKYKLDANELPEWQAFVYFLLVIVYDHVAFTFSYLSLDGQSLSYNGKVNIVSALVMTVFGLLYVYFKNGGVKGEQFFQRYFSLSVVVGIKFAILIVVIPQIVDSVSDGKVYEVLPWFGSAVFISLNIMMFWFIGSHVKSLANKVSLQD